MKPRNFPGRVQKRQYEAAVRKMESVVHWGKPLAKHEEKSTRLALARGKDRP